MAVALPELSDTPVQHPECCASLSTRMVNTIIDQLPHDDSLVLSIGCGSGLLEGLLLQVQPRLKLHGLEVASCPVKYLSPDLVDEVRGVWDISPLAASAATWLLIYPRKPSLLASYLHAYQASKLRVIVWVGPQSEWAGFENVLSGSIFNHFSRIAENGLAVYEEMVVITRDSELERTEPMHSFPGSRSDIIVDIDDI